MQSSVKNNEHGYILIELAFVVIVLSILLVVSIPLYNSFSQRNAITETQQRMEAISKALSIYTQTRFRLPCPAVLVRRMLMPPIKWVWSASPVMRRPLAQTTL